MATTFTDRDLDRLEQFLQDEIRAEDTLPADAIQGLFAAVASAPAPIPPSTWMPVVLGEEPQYADAAEADAITDLLMRFHDATVEQLNGGEGLDFVLYGEEGDELEFAAWCEGYLMGVELAEPGWAEAADDDQVEEMLFPFFVLSGRWKEALEESGEPAPPESEEREMLDEMRERLADAVLENRAFWFEHNIPDTVRREGPKIGRNDPCPCGSGKKYKNCHGA